MQSDCHCTHGHEAQTCTPDFRGRHLRQGLCHSERHEQLKNQTGAAFRARCLTQKQKPWAAKEWSRHAVVFNWCEFDVQKIRGQFPRMCVHQREEEQLGCWWHYPKTSEGNGSYFHVRLWDSPHVRNCRFWGAQDKRFWLFNSRQWS